MTQQRRVLQSLHSGEHFGISTAEEWVALREHMAHDHGVELGRPKPVRTLFDAWELQGQHDALHAADSSRTARR